MRAHICLTCQLELAKRGEQLATGMGEEEREREKCDAHWLMVVLFCCYQLFVALPRLV